MSSLLAFTFAMQVNSAIKCHYRLLFFVVSSLFAHQQIPQDLGGG